MSRRRVNARLVKIHRVYAVDEAARALDVHKNTVRRWIEQGLRALASKRPTLILGRDLRAFLDARNQRARRPCGPGTIYCCKCREPRRPALGMVDFIPHSATGGNLKALCEQCGTMMHQRIARSAISLKMPGIEVHVAGADARLTVCAPPPVNRD